MEAKNLAFLPFLILLIMGTLYSLPRMNGEYKKALGTTSPEDIETSPTKPLAIAFLKFFQDYISPTDGPRCSLYPTCSDYSLRAIRKHGLLRGAIMTFDRILHEPDEKRRGRPELIKGAYRVRDPLPENELPSRTKGKQRKAD